MRFPLLALFLTAVVFATPRAEAQFSFLPYGGYDFDAGDPLVGVGVEVLLFPETAPGGIALRPSAEYYFAADESRGGLRISRERMQFNADVIAHLTSPANRIGFFAGLGLGLHYLSLEQLGDSSSSTDLGLNILGGADYDTGFLNPFLQGRITREEGRTLATLLGGVRLSF